MAEYVAEEKGTPTAGLTNFSYRASWPASGLVISDDETRTGTVSETFNDDQKQLIQRAREFAKPFRITDGDAFHLRDVDPGETLHLGKEDKSKAKEALAMGVELLAEFQDLLYAQDRWALLLIFQAMDAAGKDGTIKHVMSGVNPQGCQVSSFKAPGSVELDHDYLWRCNIALPERGRIGIFNRSYYEDTLVVRVHKGLLRGQKIPAELIDEDI
jgi:polyphosphate kinase 2 (PPK2 family)